nr:unnamed protein product [Digitaria exilis]
MLGLGERRRLLTGVAATASLVRAEHGGISCWSIYGNSDAGEGTSLWLAPASSRPDPVLWWSDPRPTQVDLLPPGGYSCRSAGEQPLWELLAGTTRPGGDQHELLPFAASSTPPTTSPFDRPPRRRRHPTPTLHRCRPAPPLPLPPPPHHLAAHPHLARSPPPPLPHPTRCRPRVLAPQATQAAVKTPGATASCFVPLAGVLCQKVVLHSESFWDASQPDGGDALGRCSTSWRRWSSANSHF